MVEEWLSEIQNVEGVESTVIFSNRGKIIAESGLNNLTYNLEKLAICLLRISGAYLNKGFMASDYEFYWQKKYMVCKNTDQFILVTICKSPKIYSLLRITLNVVMANLLEDKKFVKDIKAAASDKTLFLKKGDFDETETKIIEKLQ